MKVKLLSRVQIFATPWIVAYLTPPSLGFSKQQASFNFMAAVTICSDSGAQKMKSVIVSTVSPSICHEVMGPDAMILVF